MRTRLLLIGMVADIAKLASRRVIFPTLSVINAKCPVAMCALTMTIIASRSALAGSFPNVLPSTLIAVRRAHAPSVPDVWNKTPWGVLNAPRLIAMVEHNKMSSFFNVALT